MNESKMTEIEIMNFAHDFVNLINIKNNEIGEMKTTIRRLTALCNTLQKTEKLTVDEIHQAERPVWVESFTYKGKGFYALPMEASGNGVITNSGGRYSYDKYGETWVAYSSRQEV